MQQKAKVQRLLPDGRAELTVVRKSACSGDCGSCGGCGAVEQSLCITADNPIRAGVGDVVYVESATGLILKAAALVYLLPLMLFLAGYFFDPSFFEKFPIKQENGFAVTRRPFSIRPSPST